MRPSALLCLAALCSSSACAQNNALFFTFPNGNVFDGSNPVVLELWTQFEPQYLAFAGWAGGVNSSDPTGKWQNYVQLSICGTAGCAKASGGSLTGMIIGQLHFPPAGIFAKTDNPIRLFSVEWTSQDLTKRKVDLATITTKYSLYLNSGMSINITPEQADGRIHVVPAPGALIAGPCLLVVAYRRARR